jgi:SAM-dependent methyltransferase
MRGQERRAMPAEATSTSLDRENAGFWNELCGTLLAKSIGVVDDSPASLKKFDDWYFAFYPYLFTHIPFEEMRDKDVLEVGLGYGTVSQRIAESGARYQGLDIAAGPVSMANHRLRALGLAEGARQGNILKAPFAEGSFDYVVAIGCLHHTGDLAAAIAECRRILRPGGKLIFMVYYAYSYRRLVQAPWETLRYLARESAGYRGAVGTGDSLKRAAYDSNSQGIAAPHTDWISIPSLRRLCRKLHAFEASLENIDNGLPFRWARPRAALLKTAWPRWVGLDIYATATN